MADSRLSFGKIAAVPHGRDCMKCTALAVSLLLCSGVSFAKKSDVPAGPFQMGTALKQVASIPMTTAEISAFMPEKNVLFVVGGENVLEIVDLADPMRLNLQIGHTYRKNYYNLGY